MRTAETQKFNIYEGDRPKVLLLGNGIPRAFGGKSWDDLLVEITDKSLSLNPKAEYDMPMSLKATLLSNNNLQEKLKNYYKNPELFSIPDKLNDFLQKLLALNFHYILTTNYTYEIECALSGGKISPYRIEKSQMHYSEKKADPRYLLRTFNRIKGHDIWHIHGEIRKPSSIVLGYYAYGRLLSKYIDQLDKRRTDFNKHQLIEIQTWIDAFVLGDVYIMGFGIDFAETDLWWLIGYKTKTNNKNEKICGKTFFFEPDKINMPEHSERLSKEECRDELLKVYGVQTKVLEYNYYREFYEKTYEYLKNESINWRTK